MSALQWTESKYSRPHPGSGKTWAVLRNVALWGSTAAFVVGVNVTILYALLMMSSVIE